MSKERFDRTVAILVKAYLNNTLVHSNCYACAVGNMVAAGLGIKYTIRGAFGRKLTWEGDYEFPASKGWAAVFCSDEEINDDGDSEIHQEIDEDALLQDAAIKQISATGYSWQELARIEYAFESAPGRNDNQDVWMFNGLMSVIDVLASIDNISLEHTEEARKMFVKA